MAEWQWTKQSYYSSIFGGIKLELDKFYTKEKIAQTCIKFLEQELNPVNPKYIEPSAGAGVFLDFLPNYIAYDIKPEHPNIKKQDYLSLNISYDKHIIVIGNPPFGKRSKLAVDFFNHSSLFAEAIGFIVPVSFLKWSV